MEEQWEDGYLIVQLLIEERNRAHVARELGVSQADLLEMSRDALEDSEMCYEDTGFEAREQNTAEQVRAGKRG